MKRWEYALALAGALLVALGARWIRAGELPRRDIVLQSAGCRTPLTIFAPPPGITPAGDVIVLHGLSANRRIMFYLAEDFAGHGMRAYVPDLPGHGDNSDPFTFARAEECARSAVEILTRDQPDAPAKTILVGHSMGGEIAVRMADKIPVAATIALSPAPMVPPQRMPANLLVFSAQFDVWQLRGEAKALQQAAGEDRSDPGDFSENRAFLLVNVPLATHTSLLEDRRVAHASELWALQALFPRAAPKTLALDLDLGTYNAFGSGRRRLAGAILGLLGIGMAMPLCIAVAAQLAGTASDPARDSMAEPKLGHGMQIAWGAIGSLGAVLLLAAWIPLRFVHLYGADYLISEALLVALLFLALNWRAARQFWSGSLHNILVAVALGAATVLAFGAWFNWTISDLWLNAPRWLRFAELLPFAFLCCYTEEAVLGPVGHGKARALRFVVSLLLRFEIWLACVAAYFLLASGQILLPILVLQLGAFSIAQRLTADALRHRTHSATGVAAFGAILVSWFFAAVFPLT